MPRLNEIDRLYADEANVGRTDLMRYRTTVDVDNQNSSQAEIVRLIASHHEVGARILDVGCASGDLGAALTDRGFVVTGIEANPEFAAIAAGRISEVVEANLEAHPISEVVTGSFDVVIFGDVLEHLVHPGAVLKSAVEVVGQGSSIVVSIPNVAHGSVRLALLQGAWTYTDEGLLDRTHLRFFTLESVIELLRNSGLVIDELKATVLDPLAAGVAIDEDTLPGSIVEWVRDQRTSYDFQYIALAHPGSPEEVEAALVPAVQRLIALPRPEDVHTERRRAEKVREAAARRNAAQLAQFEEERYRLLTAKDYAIGTEAQLGRLKYELGQRNDDLHQVRTELIATHAHLADAISDDQKAHARLHETIEALPRVRARRLASRLAHKIGLR